MIDLDIDFQKFSTPDPNKDLPAFAFSVEKPLTLVNETDSSLNETINPLKHLKTGIKCFVSSKAESQSQDDIESQASQILDALEKEAPELDKLTGDRSEPLKQIFSINDEYKGAKTIEELLKIRNSFEEASQSFPEIAESLRQVDLSATYDWQKNNSAPKDEYKHVRNLANLFLTHNKAPIEKPGNLLTDTDTKQSF